MTRALLLDLAERALWTFAQAFASFFVVTDLGTAKVAAAAGVASVLALVKGFAASRLGDKTASTVPPSLKSPDLSGP